MNAMSAQTRHRGIMHVSCFDACLREGGPLLSWKPRSCTATRTVPSSLMPATTTHTPSRSNKCRRCLITRRRSLNCVLLTLQLHLTPHAALPWTHHAAEETSTCLLRRVVSLPNSDLPAPPIDLATTTTHAPNHPLRTTTHGSSRCPAVSPGRCEHG